MPKTTRLPIKIPITAENKFTGPLSKMNRRMDRFKRSARGVSRALKRAGRAALAFGRAAGRVLKVGVVAAAGAVTALGVGIMKITEDMDKLAKTTRALNFPIEDFQEFRFAAEQSGVGVEVFDKSMKKFAKGVGEAKKGTGTMITMLRRSNPEFLKQLLNTENVSDAFSLYLDQIRKIKNPMDKAALAGAAFGRSGVDMINMANMSQEELGNLRAQMRENGVVTEEQAQLAEAFNDTMNRVKLTVLGVFRDVVVPLIPQLTKWAEQFREWAVANRELIKTKIKEWAIKFKDTLVDLWNWFKANETQIKDFLGTLLDLGKGIVKTAKFLWDMKGAVLAMAAGFVSLKVAMAGVSIMGMAGNMATMGGTAAKAAPLIGKLGAGLGKAGLVGAAAAAGIAVGTLISGMIEKSQEADRIVANTAIKMQRGLGQASLAELQSRSDRLNVKYEKTDTLGGFLSDVFTPGAENENALNEIRSAKQAVNTEILRRLEGQLSGMKPQGETWTPLAPPQASTSSTTTTNIDRTELTIRDESGRAEITKGGKGGTVNLIPTGAMP